MNKEIPIALFKTEDNKFIKYVRYEELNKYKEVLDKIKEYIKDNACYDKDIKQCCRDLLTNECDYILEILEEIE
jgi:hypothetical protein